MTLAKHIGGFFAGILIGLFFLMALGFVYAATVHYVGGKITNLGDGSASGDAITKAQADASTAVACNPLKRTGYSAVSSSAEGTVCTSCSGWVLSYSVYTTYSSTVTGFAIFDGYDGIETSVSGPGQNVVYALARFNNSLGYNVTSSGSTSYVYIDYCLE